MISGKINIDESKCKREGLCVEVCCECRVYEQNEKGAVPLIANQAECVECGHCIAVCPGGAITIKGMRHERFSQIDFSAVPDSAATELLLSSMRSVRHYLGKPVPQDIIDKLLALAAASASDHNFQDRCFFVVTDKAKIQELAAKTVDYYRKLLRMMSPPVRGLMKPFLPHIIDNLEKAVPDMERKIREYGQGIDCIFHNAPCVIVITSTRGNTLGKDTAIVAQETIRVMAHSMGLGACVSGYATAAPGVVGRVLGIPKGQQSQTVFTLGYPKIKIKKTVDRRPPDTTYI